MSDEPRVLPPPLTPSDSELDALEAWWEKPLGITITPEQAAIPGKAQRDVRLLIAALRESERLRVSTEAILVDLMKATTVENRGMGRETLRVSSDDLRSILDRAAVVAGLGKET